MHAYEGESDDSVPFVDIMECIVIAGVRCGGCHDMCAHVVVHIANKCAHRRPSSFSGTCRQWGCAIHGDDGDVAAGAAAVQQHCVHVLPQPPLPLTLASLMERMEATRDAVANSIVDGGLGCYCWFVVVVVVAHMAIPWVMLMALVLLSGLLLCFVLLHIYRSGGHFCTSLRKGTSLWQSIFLLMAPV